MRHRIVDRLRELRGVPKLVLPQQLDRPPDCGKIWRQIGRWRRIGFSGGAARQDNSGAGRALRTLLFRCPPILVILCFGMSVCGDFLVARIELVAWVRLVARIGKRFGAGEYDHR
jgi:hypothetical protein